MAALDQRGVVVSCPACSRSNRLAFGTLGKTSRCGQCKATLSPPDQPLEVPDVATFDALAAQSALPLIVDFWAEWCGPCRSVAPELQRLARTTAGRYLIVKVDTEALQEVAARFRIQSIPTLAIVYGGREIDRTAGARPAAAIQAFVERALASHQQRAS